MKAGKPRSNGLPDQMRARGTSQLLQKPMPFKILLDERVFGKTSRKFAQLINLNSQLPNKFDLNRAMQMRSLAEGIRQETCRSVFFGETQHKLLVEIGLLRNSGILHHFKYNYPFNPDIRNTINVVWEMLAAINNQIQKTAEQRNSSRY